MNKKKFNELMSMEHFKMVKLYDKIGFWQTFHNKFSISFNLLRPHNHYTEISID